MAGHLHPHRHDQPVVRGDLPRRPARAITSSSSPTRRSAPAPTCRPRRSTRRRWRACARCPASRSPPGEVFSSRCSSTPHGKRLEQARAELRRLRRCRRRSRTSRRRPGRAAARRGPRSAHRRGDRAALLADGRSDAPRRRRDARPARYRIVGIARFAGSASFGGAGVALLTLAAGAARSPVSPARSTRSSSPRRRAWRQRRCAPASARCCRGRSTCAPAPQEAAQQTSDLESQLGFLRTFLLIFAYVALFVGAFIIFNTFSITVAQRTREFGLLRTLGATRAAAAALGRRRGCDARASAARRSGCSRARRSRPALDQLFKAFGADLPDSGTVVELRTVWVSLLAGTAVTVLAGARCRRSGPRASPRSRRCARGSRCARRPRAAGGAGSVGLGRAWSRSWRCARRSRSSSGAGHRPRSLVIVAIIVAVRVPQRALADHAGASSALIVVAGSRCSRAPLAWRGVDRAPRPRQHDPPPRAAPP